MTTQNNLKITNINTENGGIYFHCDSVPYSLEDIYNSEVLYKLVKYYECTELTERDLEYMSIITDYSDLIENYILELQSDWIEIEESDTDNYLTEIDEGFFESEFLTVTYDKRFSKSILYYFKINGNYIECQLSEKVKGKFNIYIFDVNEVSNNEIVTDLDEVNTRFFEVIRESNSYLAQSLKDILIRSHSEFLNELSKKQVVVI